MHTPLKDNEELVLKLAADGWTANKMAVESEVLLGVRVRHESISRFLARRNDPRYQKTLASSLRAQHSEKGKATSKRHMQTPKYKAAKKRYRNTPKGKLAAQKAILTFMLRNPERWAEGRRKHKAKFQLEHGEPYDTFYARTGGIRYQAAMQESINKNETVIWNSSRKDKQ